MKSVYCAVRTGSLNKSVCHSSVKGSSADFIGKSEGSVYQHGKLRVVIPLSVAAVVV
jgi:hypothetical protein